MEMEANVTEANKRRNEKKKKNEQHTFCTVQRGFTGSLAAVTPVKRTALAEMLARLMFTGTDWDV